MKFVSLLGAALTLVAVEFVATAGPEPPQPQGDTTQAEDALAEPPDESRDTTSKDANPTKTGPAEDIGKGLELPDPESDAPTSTRPAEDIGKGLELPDPESDAPSSPPASKAKWAPTLRDRLDTLPFELALRAEFRVGVRTTRRLRYRRAALREGRLSVHLEKHVAPAELKLVSDIDVIGDHLASSHRPDLATGEGFVDLRTAYFSMQPAPWLQLLMGRQIATWGTGDLLFINDVFPKDFRSFVLGRDLTYLKAPTDGARLQVRLQQLELTAIYAPRLNTDRIISGERAAYWNGARLSEPNEPPLLPITPNQLFEDDELAIRASAVIRRYELSLYGYEGFDKSPTAIDQESGRPTFARRRQGGFSVRGPLAFGLAWFEAAAAISLDDRSGNDPLVPNSETKALLGYEAAIGPVVSLTVQGQLTRMSKYQAYQQSLLAEIVAVEQFRVRTTARLELEWTKRELRVSMFSFYNPTERDGHFRFRVEQRFGGALVALGGTNIFYGRNSRTSFGQLTDASNVYTAIRYSL